MDVSSILTEAANDPTGLKAGAAKCAIEGHTSPKHLIADGKHRGVMNCVRCGFRMYVD